MRKFLYAILITAMLLPWPVSASAQSAIEIEQMTIRMWPEYDAPNMLVIFDLVLPEGLSYPVSVQLPMPGNVAAPFVVASGSEPAAVGDSKDFQVSEQNGQNVITYLAAGPYVHYEFYDDALAFAGATRSYDFELVFAYPIATVKYDIQVPIDGDQMILSSDLAQPVGKSDGLNYYAWDVDTSAMNVGDALALTITYQKSSDVLTLAAIQAAQGLELPPVETAAADTVAPGFLSDFASNLTPVSMIFLGLGVVLIGVGFYNYWQVQQSQSSQRGSKRRHSGGGKGKAEVFCHNCGEAGSKDDKFCRECGSKLRL